MNEFYGDLLNIDFTKEVFGSGELDADSVIRKFRTTAADGKIPFVYKAGVKK